VVDIDTRILERLGHPNLEVRQQEVTQNKRYWMDDRYDTFAWMVLAAGPWTEAP